jgi:hypothetical protein
VDAVARSRGLAERGCDREGGQVAPAEGTDDLIMDAGGWWTP